MLTALAWFSLMPMVATAAPAPALAPPAIETIAFTEAERLAERQAVVVRYQEIRPLPGRLDAVPVFNSNSPELVQEEGILLSTFPTDGMAEAEAHLDFAFEGRFDIFAHHVARGLHHGDRRTLFMGTVVYNPSDEPVELEVLQGVSYLSQEAPFRDLPAYVANPVGQVFAGPGSRTVTDILQGRHQDQWPEAVTIPPRQAYLLMNAPIPLRRLSIPTDATLPPGLPLPGEAIQANSRVVASSETESANLSDRPLPSNGRSALLYLTSNGPVYVANLAMYAPRDSRGQERAPTLREWLNLLTTEGLAGPRDIAPTNPDTYSLGRFFYGRVAGVAQGSEWTAFVTDGPNHTRLTIPAVGQAFSYVVSTVDHNTLGTGQIQSAPIVARYDDTAYRAHGNYGIHYNLSFPLYNPTETSQTVVVKLQTPLQNEALTEGLRFRNPPDDRIFFRGTVRIRYPNGVGLMQNRYIHVVQRRGQEGEPLLQFRIPAGVQRLVEVELIYPPDATPPQVLTLTTLGDPNVIEANVRP
jgi:hypothetical protein